MTENRWIGLEYLEVELPLYLQKSLDDYRKGTEEGSPYLDALYMDLQSSINKAEVDLRIDSKQAEYLRKIYLYYWSIILNTIFY